MLPLYQDPFFTFRFADDRIIPRFQLDGLPAGKRVQIHQIDPDTNTRLRRLASATVGPDGWVDLREPIIVRAGEAFVAVPIASPTIVAEAARHHDDVRQIHRLAFGQDDEARLVDALRSGGFAPVSLVAEINGRAVGHILFSDLPIITVDGTVPALALAPLAVHHDFQHQGIGSELVRRGLDACKTQGHRIVVVLGHADFYPRFGFSSTLAARLDSPYSGSPSFMAAELTPGALTGVIGKVGYARPFHDL